MCTTTITRTTFFKYLAASLARTPIYAKTDLRDRADRRTTLLVDDCQIDDDGGGLNAPDRNEFTNARVCADGIEKQMSFVIVREADLVSD